MNSKNHSKDVVKLVRDFRVPSQFTDDSILDILSSFNCPRALTVYLLYKHGEHQQLVDLDIDPCHYNDPWSFRDAYGATLFLSKSNFLKLDLNREQAAFSKFFKYEELCRSTNERFRRPLLDPLYKGANVALLDATRRKIERILGTYTGDEFVDLSNWGPGVTTLLKGECVSATNKFHLENGITRDLYSLVNTWFPHAYPLWGAHLTAKYTEHWANYQVGNKIVTVPKNSKTDRVIAIEPGLNLWFQKGIGKMISRRLARFGIDLSDQGRNQFLSRQGSLTSSLATIDFSSASDSISLEVVRYLLPNRWLTLLEKTRSVFGTHDNTLIRWEKFSSMGNGFTFELESLIFYAAALAVCEYSGVSSANVSVFGDDVIIPNELSDLYSSFCAFLGFRVNTDKSFSSSYFRESCGSHWFDGVDVKPIFLKERVRNAQAVYKLANSVRNLAHRRNSHYGCDARFHRCWRNLYRGVPKLLQLTTSRETGDAGFAVNFDEASPPAARNGIEGFRPLVLLETGLTGFSDGLEMLLTRLKVPSIQEYGNTYTLRCRTRISASRILVPRWYNYGPWY